MSEGREAGLPADDLSRALVVAWADGPSEHIALVGDTYTMLLTGEQTAGQYCLIDMFVPPGGGPPPHRHDFEESFILLEGKLEATFRGQRSEVRAGETVHIPANAPHQFRNISQAPARMLCICSPAGQEKLFAKVGVPVADRTAAAPPLDADGQARLRKKAEELAPQYKTELLGEA